MSSHHTASIMTDKKVVWAHSPAADEIPEDVIFVDRLRCTGCCQTESSVW